MRSSSLLSCRAVVPTLMLVIGLASGPAFAAADGTASSFPPPPPPDTTASTATDRPPPAPTASAMDQFRETLQRFGSFHQHPLYGEVWRPSEQVAAPGWSPYPRCHWQFDREQRTWVFNDPTEWGGIVHRHGRWANDPQFGWVWIADANFGPGWVVWRTGQREISWAPMLPDQHGGQSPREGWQTQDQMSFNAGCRQPGPPPPQRAAAPMMPGPAMMGEVGYGAIGGAVIGGGVSILVIDRCRRQPWLRICRPVVGGLPPSCSTGIRPSWCRPVCATRPHLPGCRRPGPVVGGVQLPPGATPGPLGALCATRPHLPACRGVNRPNLRPFVPRPSMGRPIMPRPIIVRPGPRPGPFMGRPGHRPGPFMGRPGHRPGFGGGRMARR
ncbi:DUF6600 domain-containing protein [Phreatobacter sp.]|uniref:DUF6600 domain-containing protein n=1 Tax=Phreatobacter sp. TaxID=1966341 RepID=UPI003F71BC10